MPDGRSLKDHLRTERESNSSAGLKKRSQGVTGPRGKDVHWQQLQDERSRLVGPSAEHEAAEIRMLQGVGVRRRRRWLNDKLLRDMAGPLSAADMASLFQPAPFGETNWVSPLTLIARPENAVVWDSFRSIDSEKQNRVLQKWTEYNDQQRGQAGGRSGGSARGAAAASNPAAEALRKWARVGRNARQALRRANVSTVLALELQLLEWLEQSPLEEQQQLVLPMSDGFGRLLVHGLADFHGLLSAATTTPSVAEEDEESAAAAAAPARQGVSPAAAATPPAATGIAVYHRQIRQAAGASETAAADLPAPPHGASPQRLSTSSRTSAGGSTPVLPPSSEDAGAGAGVPPATPPPPARHSSPAERQPSPQVGGGPGRQPSPGHHARQPSPQTARPDGAAAGGLADAGDGAVAEAITCTDVLLALAEVGDLNQRALQRYVRTHIHGVSGSDASTPPR